VKIALILPILLSGILFAEEKSQDKLQYETDIAFKYYADLSNTYHRCASLYTAIYGYASNTPDGKFLNIRITTIFLNIMINCHIDDQDYGY